MQYVFWIAELRIYDMTKMCKWTDFINITATHVELTREREKIRRMVPTSDMFIHFDRHYQMLTSDMAWTSFTNGSPWTSATSCHMGTWGFQEDARSTATELKRCRQERSQENGHQLDEVEDAAEDRRSWRNRVSQCVFDTGWTRNQEHECDKKTDGRTDKKAIASCILHRSSSRLFRVIHWFDRPVTAYFVYDDLYRGWQNIRRWHGEFTPNLRQMFLNVDLLENSALNQ